MGIPQTLTPNIDPKYCDPKYCQRIIKEGQQGRTVYVNQYYVVKNGATVSKHIFAGTTRLATALVHGEKADRVGRSGSTSGGTANSTQDDAQGSANVAGGRTPGATKSAGNSNGNSHAGKSGKAHPGKGLEHRSATADEHAQNTVKNPNLTGTLPRQAGAHRSENSQAKDVEHNPHLQGEPTDPWVTDKGKLGDIQKLKYYKSRTLPIARSISVLMRHKRWMDSSDCSFGKH